MESLGTNSPLPAVTLNTQLITFEKSECLVLDTHHQRVSGAWLLLSRNLQFYMTSLTKP